MGGFSNFESLKRWFYQNERDGKPANYWTLYIGDYGDKEKIAAFNDRVESQDDSFNMLVNNIRDLNNPAGVRFRVMVTDKPRHNVPVAQAYVQIFATAPQSVPGIAGMDASDVDKKIADAIAREKEKWVMEHRIAALEEQLNAPPSGIGEKIETYLSNFLGSPVGGLIIARLAGISPDQLAAFNGVHGHDSNTPDGAASDDIDDDLDALERNLGQDAGTILKKIRRFSEADPATAKQLLQSL